MAQLVEGEFSKYWSPDKARQKALQSYLDRNNPVAESNQVVEQLLPEYDYGMKAMQLGSKTADLNYQSSQNAAYNASVNAINQALQQQADQYNSMMNGLNTGSGGSINQNNNPRLGPLLRALRQQESSNNFKAVNPRSGALGAYQVMPSNLPSWSREAIGRSVSTSEFLSSRKLQNRIVKYKFGQYLKKHGARGALAAWYSGKPERWNDKTPVSGGPSVYDYVMKVLSRL